MSLPIRFAKSMLQLLDEVDTLFSDSYPLVLTHTDLCEMNVLVDPKTGHINGIIDWADTRNQPFGLALWGVENVLGYMDGEGWHYLNDHEQLEKLFWTTFEDEVGTGIITVEMREKIRTARLVGIALRYGFAWDATDDRKPISESHSSFRYLNAFLDTKT